MKLSMKEKKILYAFACPSHHNTVTRLKWLTALTVDPEAKRRMLGLARKVETEVDESWYEDFYHHLRMEMDEYRRLKRSLRVLKSYNDYSLFLCLINPSVLENTLAIPMKASSTHSAPIISLYPFSIWRNNTMEFFNQSITVLQTLVVAIGAGLGVWGVVNLMEGYGNDNPGANAHVS